MRDDGASDCVGGKIVQPIRNQFLLDKPGGNALMSAPSIVCGFISDTRQFERKIGYLMLKARISLAHIVKSDKKRRGFRFPPRTNERWTESKRNGCRVQHVFPQWMPWITLSPQTFEVSCWRVKSHHFVVHI
jgi:hypothetical protein